MYLMHGFLPYFSIDNKVICNGIHYDKYKSIKELNDIKQKSLLQSIKLNSLKITKKYNDECKILKICERLIEF